MKVALHHQLLAALTVRITPQSCYEKSDSLLKPFYLLRFTSNRSS